MQEWGISGAPNTVRFPLGTVEIGSSAASLHFGALTGPHSITANAALTLATLAGNGDVIVTPHGTGMFRYGTHNALGAETVTGYIEMKDAGGTTRKLAVVS
jgi:hypothetical protein